MSQLTRRGRWRRTSLLVGVACWFGGGTAGFAAASGELITGEILLVDPAGDDHGPGSYQYPVDARLPMGTFDLTALRLTTRKDQLLAEFCFRARPQLIRGIRTSTAEVADLYPQAFELYLDTDGVRGSGFDRPLPGRSLAIDPEFAWEQAIAFSPRPALFRHWLQGIEPQLASRTKIPDTVTQRGRCLRLEVPLAEVGRPAAGWGVLVLVTGARFSSSVGLLDWVKGTPRPHDFTRDFLSISGTCASPDDGDLECAFGGCRPCGNHPRIMDALLDGNQEAVLSAYDPAAGRLAMLRGVRLGSALTPADPGGAAPAPRAGPVEPVTEGLALRPAPTEQAVVPDTGYRILDISGALLSITGGASLPVGRIGEVVAGERVIGRLVIIGQAGPVILAQPVGNVPDLVRGLEVRFEGGREL